MIGGAERGREGRLGGRAKGELAACGAVLVEDPFAGSGLAALRKPTLPGHAFDARGLESVPHGLEQHLKRLGPDAALRTFAESAAATATEDPFAPGGVRAFRPTLPQSAACLADPTRPPDLSELIAAREAYLGTFDEVFARKKLDALVFPQTRSALGPLHGSDTIHVTTVSEINIAGLPGVTVPAGFYAPARPSA